MRWKGSKGKAWESVRVYVKAREKDCYTCGAKNLEGINAQAGHYRTVTEVGSNNKRAWDSRFIHLQCSYCNGPRQGAQAKFRERLVQDYGKAIVDQYDFEVDSKAYAAIKNWQAVIDEYEALVENL